MAQPTCDAAIAADMHTFSLTICESVTLCIRFWHLSEAYETSHVASRFSIPGGTRI